MDLKTRRRWSQNQMSTSQTLKTVLRDLLRRDREKRLGILEESGRLDETASSTSRIPA
jgi:hypothetical protein